MTAFEACTDAELETLRDNLTGGCLTGLAHHAAGTLHDSPFEGAASPHATLGVSYALLLQVEAVIAGRVA